jgi:hypothetical protein
MRGPRRKPAMAGLLAPALAGGLLMLSLTGCAQQLKTPCAVVVDGSGSGARFDAKTRLDSRLPRFLSDKKCGTLTYVPITTDSAADTCTAEDLELDPDLQGNRESVRAGRLEKAKKDAAWVLACAQKKDPLSDVLGALSRAVTQRPDGSGAYQVLVVSDMLENDASVHLERDDLSTPQQRRAVIDRLVHDERIPNMRDMSLEVTDRARGIQARDPVKYGQIAAFWRELFASKAAGSPEVKYD